MNGGEESSPFLPFVPYSWLASADYKRNLSAVLPFRGWLARSMIFRIQLIRTNSGKCFNQAVNSTEYKFTRRLFLVLKPLKLWMFLPFVKRLLKVAFFLFIGRKLKCLNFIQFISIFISICLVIVSFFLFGWFIKACQVTIAFFLY